MELLLDDEQSEELCSVMKQIEEMCPDELQEIFQEGDSHAVGSWCGSWTNLMQRKTFLKIKSKMVSILRH